jgi:hypothetical protein
MQNCTAVAMHTHNKLTSEGLMSGRYNRRAIYQCAMCAMVGDLGMSTVARDLGMCIQAHDLSMCTGARTSVNRAPARTSLNRTPQHTLHIDKSRAWTAIRKSCASVHIPKSRAGTYIAKSHTSVHIAIYRCVMCAEVRDLAMCAGAHD